VADQEGADQLVLVGFSMAGRFTQYMPYLAPWRVRGQILISPAAAAPFGVPREVLLQWCEAAPYPERFQEILLSFIKIPPKPQLVDLYCATVASAPRLALEGTMRMFDETSIVEQVQQTRVPTLVICPTADALISPAYVRQGILALIPGARLALLDCGQEASIERPQETAGLIEAFVAGLGA
jgi:non-heme chloroperoxidase